MYNKDDWLKSSEAFKKTFGLHTSAYIEKRKGENEIDNVWGIDIYIGKISRNSKFRKINLLLL